MDGITTWALVLAAGEGTRLRRLTTAPSGTTVPKQFCSLYDGPSLLQEALLRSQAVAKESHTCAVVARQHRRWWEESLRSLPAENVIVQPENRGTGNGILLSLLHILDRDPNGRIVLLPSDHYVRHESVLAAALRKGVEQLRSRPGETVLLGLEPEEADPELGYIVPGFKDGEGVCSVERFTEKPAPSEAVELMRAGAMWNAFIIVSSVQNLLAMFRRRVPEIVAQMHAAVQSDLHGGTTGAATARLYESLPVVDFSRDILPGQEFWLRVLSVPRCGWTDLGTPRRVADVLGHSPRCSSLNRVHGALTNLSLAAQHARLLASRTVA